MGRQEKYVFDIGFSSSLDILAFQAEILSVRAQILSYRNEILSVRGQILSKLL